jgi:hypothetical protein
MNNGKVKVYRVLCGRCMPHDVIPLLCITGTKRSAMRIALAHSDRTHHIPTPRIVGRYIRPDDYGQALAAEQESRS